MVAGCRPAAHRKPIRPWEPCMHSVLDCKQHTPHQHSLPESVARARLQACHSDLHGLPHLQRLPVARRLVGDERAVLQLPEVAVGQLHSTKYGGQRVLLKHVGNTATPRSSSQAAARRGKAGERQGEGSVACELVWAAWLVERQPTAAAARQLRRRKRSGVRPREKQGQDATGRQRSAAIKLHRISAGHPLHPTHLARQEVVHALLGAAVHIHSDARVAAAWLAATSKCTTEWSGRARQTFKVEGCQAKRNKSSQQAGRCSSGM